jgi:cobaltochelatase CobN
MGRDDQIAHAVGSDALASAEDMLLLTLRLLDYVAADHILENSPAQSYRRSADAYKIALADLLDSCATICIPRVRLRPDVQGWRASHFRAGLVVCAGRTSMERQRRDSARDTEYHDLVRGVPRHPMSRSDGGRAQGHHALVHWCARHARMAVWQIGRFVRMNAGPKC